MKGMKKRGLCLALSLYIVAGSATNSYASASVVIGGGVAVGVEYAFAWLLGAVGLTAASVAVYENADSIKAWGAQQNREFCQWVQANADAYNEWADVTEDKINDWCDRVAKGAVDKGSSVWQAFKDWASSIYVRGGVVSPPVGDYVEISQLSQYFSNVKFYWGEPDFELPDVVSSSLALSEYWVVINHRKFGSYNQTYRSFDSPLSIEYVIGDSFASLHVPVPAMQHEIVFKKNGTIMSNETSTIIKHFTSKISDSTDYVIWCSPSVSVLVGDEAINFPDVSDDDSYAYVGGVSDVFDRDGSLDNVDLVGVGSDADAKDIPVVWPGNDALVDILAGLAAGAESWSQVLEDAGVVPVDRAGDTVVDDEGVTDEPIAGVIPPLPPSVPSELKDYTVDGLSDLFPFCLPFDLIDFLGVLAADPEAPCFTWTFYYPSLDGMKSYDFEIDLSPFNSVAQLLRDMECILFVVGLILITRDQMIKG